MKMDEYNFHLADDLNGDDIEEAKEYGIMWDCFVKKSDSLIAINPSKNQGALAVIDDILKMYMDKSNLNVSGIIEALVKTKDIIEKQEVNHTGK